MVRPVHLVGLTMWLTAGGVMVTWKGALPAGLALSPLPAGLVCDVVVTGGRGLAGGLCGLSVVGG